MLYTKIDGHQPSGFGEEDFKGFLPYMSMATILATWPGLFEQTFSLTTHKISTWNLASMGLAALQQQMLKSIKLIDLGRMSHNHHDLW